MALTRRNALAAGFAMGLSTAITGAATAQEGINMTAIDGYPERSMWVAEFSGFFIPRVDELLRYWYRHDDFPQFGLALAGYLCCDAVRVV